MSSLITRNKVQFDTSHGGSFNDTLDDTAVPYIKGTNNNHSQKVVTDTDFVYDDTEVDDTVSPATGKKLTVKNENVEVDLSVGRDEHVGRDVEIGRDIDVQGNAHFVGREVHEDPTDPTSPLIPNVTNEGTLEQQDKAHFLDTVEIEKKTTIHYDPDDANKESLEVAGVSQFNDNVYINADLYVKGATYDTKVTELNVGADHITVRDENNASMTTGESAGILINKYDGADSLGIVASADGTLRIGEYNITHVFTDDDTTYYAEKELINVVDVTGKTLYPIGDQTGTIKEKYFVAKDETEPVATRDAEEDMENDYLTKWDSTGKDIVTSATNETRVVNTEIVAKESQAEIADLQHGKIDLDLEATDPYPLEVTKYADPSYTQVSAGLNTFVANKLVRSEVGDHDNYEFKSPVPLYIQSGVGPIYTYTEVTNYKLDDGSYYYSTDNGTNWTAFNDPTIFYYTEGNQVATQYRIEVDPESVIRHFDTAQDFRYEVAATVAGTSENPLKVGNTIHIEDQLGIQSDVVGAQEILPVGAIGISDRVERGNYDAVTSNALAEAIENMVLPEAGFLQSFPVGSVYTTTSSTAPSIGTTTWQSLGTLNGAVLGTGIDIYFYKRLS